MKVNFDKIAEKTKKAEEIRKINEAEDNEIQNLFKRAGNILYILGDIFIKECNLSVGFFIDGKGPVVKGYYRNKGKIGVIVPEIENLPLGIHKIQIEVSMNGQQFTRSGLQFNFLAFTPDMTNEQRLKYEDEEMKKLKKPPGKK